MIGQRVRHMGSVYFLVLLLFFSSGKQSELQNWFANQDNITNGIAAAVASLDVIRRECAELEGDVRS